MSSLILVVDDESDVETLFRQQFRRELRAGRFTMDFVQSGDSALQHINDTGGAPLVLILSDINMPGMSGLEMPAEDAGRRGNKEARNRAGSHWAADQAHRLHLLREEIDTRLGPAN